ncbi:MAG: zinc-dependent dehydrogenase [Nitrososphaerota archaeon]|nr:zinc-dependent dehydrogenase [Candidatus Bathyarchaeota archaeon]MDW8048960.1 zinc-dependent dehydrogenase [Nitrososphaerota archaeon]
MGRSMRAFRFHAPGYVKVEDTGIPKVGPRDILVEVKVALTCGTDVKMYKRGHPKVKPPVTLGHEFSGIIAEAGDKAAGRFRVGDRVSVANSAPCNTCFFCKVGKPNLCEHLMETLIGFSVDGAFAEYVLVPAPIVEQNTYKIPENVSFEEAALLEPLACAINGCEAADIGLGDTVVIIGSGPIGLIHLQLAKMKGASRVIVTDLREERLKTAEKLGADVLINASKEDQVSRVKELTNGLGADIVIEAVGLPETWETAVQMTRKAGTTLFFGGCPSGSTIKLDTERIHYEDLTLKGIFHHTPFSVYKAFKLISSGRFNGRPLISERMRLEETEKALNKMGSGECIKIGIIP